MPFSEHVRTIGQRVREYYGKQYHEEQSKMVGNWLLEHVKPEELEPLYSELVSSYQYKGSLPLVYDFQEVLKKIRAQNQRPTVTPEQKKITTQEIRESEKIWARLGRTVGLHEKPQQVPMELAKEVTLEDYRNFQMDFDEYLVHQAAERFCGSECKSPMKGYHRTKEYSEQFQTWYFRLRKCTAWRDNA